MSEELARQIAIRIMVPSKDRQGGEEEACLYGTEYYLLEDGVVGILMGEDGEEGAEAVFDHQVLVDPLGGQTGIRLGQDDHSKRCAGAGSLAGDLAARDLGQISLTAADLIDYLPQVSQRTRR